MKTQNWGPTIGYYSVWESGKEEYIINAILSSPINDPYRGNGAIIGYMRERMNGNKSDNPSQKMPEDGYYTWIKGRMEGEDVYGVRNGYHYEYEIRYNQGPRDKAWMEETDKNYLERIELESNLKTFEPAIYYLRLQEHATNSIREWWTQKLLLPNLPQILEQAEKAATPQALTKLEQEVSPQQQQEAKQAQIASLQTKLQQTIDEVKRLLMLVQANTDLQLLPQKELEELKTFISWLPVLPPATSMDEETLNKNLKILKNRQLYLAELPEKLTNLAAEKTKAEQEAMLKAKQLRLAPLRDKLQLLINESKKLLLHIQINPGWQLLPQQEQQEIQRFKDFVGRLNVAYLTEARLNEKLILISNWNSTLLVLPQRLNELTAEKIKKEKRKQLQKLIISAKKLLLTAQAGGKTQYLPVKEQMELKKFIGFIQQSNIEKLDERELNEAIAYIENQNRYLSGLPQRLAELEEDAKLSSFEAALIPPKTIVATPKATAITILPAAVAVKLPTMTAGFLPPHQPPAHLPVAVAVKPPTMPAGVLHPYQRPAQFNRCIHRGELQFIEELGRGGFGVVYKATWYQELVAVKELHTPKLTDTSKEEFLNETEIMAKLNYPRIVQLYGICLDPCCLVMEYLPRGSLYNILHSKAKYPWVVSLQISYDIGCGLEFLHQAQIIHRDLKSANVLLDNNFRAKICDFGLAKTRQEVTTVSTKMVVGSPSWKAPEIFGIRPRYSSASDVYAYGMVMWEILTRANPYEGVDASEIKAAVLQGEREEIPATCSPSYARLIAGCWAQRAEDRPNAKVATQCLEQQIQEAQAAEVKSWHCDPAAKPHTATCEQQYYLLDGTENDKRKVVGFYQRYPVNGMEIKSVRIVYNLEFNRGFSARLAALQGRHNNPGFTPSWLQENHPQWRQATAQLLEQRAKPYQDPDCPNVKIIAMWHGTRSCLLDSIFKAGYASLATTDDGFFGKGLYGCYEAEYAYRVYGERKYGSGNGALLVNWMACYSAYPVIDGDETKLAGKGAYANYDAHFAPVKPRNPLDPTEIDYLPCKPNEPATYHEFVVFESAQCLPRYLVELQPSLPKAPSMTACVATHFGKKPVAKPVVVDQQPVAGSKIEHH